MSLSEQNPLETVSEGQSAKQRFHNFLEYGDISIVGIGQSHKDVGAKGQAKRVRGQMGL